MGESTVYPWPQGGGLRYLLFDIVDQENRNSLLIQQAREDAQNMHKGSRMEKVKRHARRFSTKVVTTEDGILFGDDLH